MERSILIYLVFVNIMTFILFGIDKWKAIHDKWRIQESTLLFFSFMGGATGGLLGMNLFHHKIRKVYFRVGIPIMILCHTALLLLLLHE